MSEAGRDNETKYFKTLLKASEAGIFLMITNSGKWHYLAAKSLSRLLKDITLDHHGDYYCMNFLYSFRTEKKT